MTEAEWLASTDPVATFDHVRQAKVMTYGQLRLWAAESLGWKVEDICNVRQVFREEYDGALRTMFRLSDRGSNGDMWNYAVTDEVRCAALLRCCVGNPYRPRTLRFDALAPPWVGVEAAATMRRMARDARDERDWGLLPLIADALEYDGLVDEPLLAHLRDEGPHGRGCHALALILGEG